jgi:hypothetical protein
MAHRSDTGLSARTLRITNIPGKTRVKLASAGTRTMAIELSGPEAILKDISWKVRDSVLHISGPETGGGGVMISNFSSGDMTVHGGRAGSVIIGGRGVSVVSAGRRTVISTGRRRSTVIVDGKVVIGPGAGADDPGEAELTVHVPAGSAVQVSDDGAGAYEIGDTNGPLDLKIEGFSQIRAGAVSAARIAIGGSAEISLASVSDEFRVSIAGSGSVRASHGDVSLLRLSVSGSGSIAFGGTAAEADLDVSGSGRIRVDTVTGTLRRDVSGSGRIDVRQQPHRSASDFWN